MKKKITIPESIADITLGQYQNFVANPNMKIEIFTGLNKKEIDGISQKDLDYLNNQIDVALNSQSIFKQKFTLNDIEFGMIPNFDKITSKEYFDLSSYGVDIDTLHNVMAIAFRPIKDKGSLYTIDDYNGTEQYAETMKQMPLNYVNGFLSFFLTLQNDLLNCIQKYTMEEQAMEYQLQTTLKNGVGMQPSMN